MVAQIGEVLASFWNLFTSVQVPGLNIPFSVLYLGIFAIAFSIKVLMPILGIGGSVEEGPIRAGRSIRAHREARQRKTSAKQREAYIQQRKVYLLKRNAYPSNKR